MTIEQMQQISELTTKAVNENDIDTIKNLYKIIQDDDDPAFEYLGIEWFESLLTSEIHNIIFE